MKQIILSLLLLFSLTSCNDEKEKTVAINATSYIVLEQTNNKILDGFNYYNVRSVASISKIMTAIIAIENSNIEEIVIVPNDIKKVDGSSMYLKVGQEISIKELLYGLLLRSGNDAAITIALSVCDTIDEFVELMNIKAKELNMKNTIFNNPTGLDTSDDGNLSTAYDMAILYSYCLDNPMFSMITSTKSYKIYINKNKLLRNYAYCTGGKTGYTTKAKRTLITSAFKDGKNIIIVSLNCGNDFQTHHDLYEYYFNNYTSIKILNKGENSFDNHTFYCSKDYYFLVNLSDVKLLYFLNLSQRYIEVTLFDKNDRVVDYAKIKITY